MKEVVALLWVICVAVIAIYLHVNKTIDKTSTGMLFTLAIIVGLVIANYDLISKFKGLGIEVETARKEIDIAKGKALSEIEKEVAEHKESISMLIRNENELSKKLESQKDIVNAIIKRAESLEVQLKDEQEQLEDAEKQIMLAHSNTQAIFNATKELSVILTRITYIQSQTKSEFGSSPRLTKAAEIIERDINRVLMLMIPDPNERDAFVTELKGELPPR